MRIDKIITAIITTSLIGFSSTCFALAYWSDLKIGEVYYEQTVDDLVSKYGKPLREDWETTDYDGVVRYGYYVQDTVLWINIEDGVVTGAAAVNVKRKKSKLMTSEGIGFGATIEDVINVYGTPDSDKMVQIVGKKERRLEYHTSKIEINDLQSPYKAMLGKLRFFFKNNKVDTITFLYDYNRRDSGNTK